MNRYRISRLLFLLCALLTAACNRRTDADNKTSHCYCSAGYYHFSANGASVSYPTAFTPNGDGRNDVFRPVTANIQATGYSITIYSEAGSLVFASTDPYAYWNGQVNGAAAAGRYDAVFSFTTLNGDVISSCTCFYALGYDSRGCLPGGQGYTFEDQFDSAGAAAYATSETVCP